jgi:hypothetical protein
MGKQIAPNVPISGWIFFARPKNFDGLEGTTIQWKFTAEDSVGNKIESITNLLTIQRKVEQPTALTPNAATLNFATAHQDISGEIKHIVFP